MGKSLHDARYQEETLYDHMPVYHARLAGVRSLIAQPENLNLNAVHMHYDGLAPLERAAEFFDDTGILLNLGWGYGSNVVWFAHNMPELKSLLGVDLMSEHIETATLLTIRFLGNSQKTRFLAMDIAALHVGRVEVVVDTLTVLRDGRILP